jgi:hypothetical protein
MWAASAAVLSSLGCNEQPYDDANVSRVSARVYSLGPWETSKIAIAIERLGGDPSRYPSTIQVTDDKLCLRAWRTDNAEYLECMAGRAPRLARVPEPALEQAKGINAMIHAIPHSAIRPDGRVHAWFGRRGSPNDFIRSGRILSVENAFIDSRGWAYCHGSQPVPATKYPDHGIYVGLYDDISAELRTRLRGWPVFLVSWKNCVVIGTTHTTYGVYKHDERGWHTVIEDEARDKRGHLYDILDYDPGTSSFLLYRETSVFLGVKAGRVFLSPLSSPEATRRVQWNPGGIVRFVDPSTLQGL